MRAPRPRRCDIRRSASTRARRGGRAPAERRARSAIDVEGVGHVVVCEPSLLQKALRGQHVAQTLARRGLARELDDLDEALASEPLEVEVRQSQRDPQPLGKGPLRQGPTFAYGRQDFEIALTTLFHCTTESVQHLNTLARAK